MVWPVLRYFYLMHTSCSIPHCQIFTKVELNRKRENELTQMRKDFDTQMEDNEKTVADLRKKHATAITELEEKVDSLQKAKAK